MPRQVLHEIDSDGGEDQEEQHRRPGRYHTVFAGEPAIEGNGGAEENRKGGDNRGARIGEGRDAELDDTIDYAQDIAECQPARRRTPYAMNSDGHEGRGQQAGDA